MRFFKMDNSTKGLFEVVIDDLDEVLSQAVDKHELDEHRKLSSTNFSFHTDSEGREYLLYSEGVLKNKPGWIETQKINSSKQQGVC